MNDFERTELEKAARLLDNWLHCGKVDKPRQALLDSMQTAAKVMQKADASNYTPIYSRVCAVLNYHAANPLALLFRDPVTIGAVKAAIAVLDKELARQE